MVPLTMHIPNAVLCWLRAPHMFAAGAVFLGKEGRERLVMVFNVLLTKRSCIGGGTTWFEHWR